MADCQAVLADAPHRYAELKKVEVMKITLTFDNGPHREVTPEVLNILAKRKIPATFFVLGQNLVKPDLREISEDCLQAGHEIGNHTYSHSAPLGELSDDAAISEVFETQQLLQGLVRGGKLFRPVGRQGRIGTHMFSQRTWEYVRAEGYTCVLWNCLAEEWIDPDAWVAPTLDRCKNQAWSVVVLHDIATGAIAHLPEFLDALIAEGAQFRQDFPDDCIACANGQEKPLANRIVADRLL
jgi:peptidoglycan-N-acetylglucosamine deacetylase